jgi:hypothetical protein
MVYLRRAGKKVNRSAQSNYLNHRNFFTIFYYLFKLIVIELFVIKIILRPVFNDGYQFKACQVAVPSCCEKLIFPYSNYFKAIHLQICKKKCISQKRLPYEKILEAGLLSRKFDALKTMVFIFMKSRSLDWTFQSLCLLYRKMF